MPLIKLKNKDMRRPTIDPAVFSYIIDSIDGSGYDKDLETTKEKLQFVVDCYNSEYNFPANKRFMPNNQERFANWLMGLPSSINIDYENYRILEIAKEWGSIPNDATEKQEDKILYNWFNFISAKFIKLCHRNKVEI